MPKAYFNDYDRKIASFRAWFKGKRAEKDINQAYLARKIGATQATVSRKIQPRGDKQVDTMGMFKTQHSFPVLQ